MIVIKPAADYKHTESFLYGQTKNKTKQKKSTGDSKHERDVSLSTMIDKSTWNIDVLKRVKNALLFRFPYPMQWLKSQVLVFNIVNEVGGRLGW